MPMTCYQICKTTNVKFTNTSIEMRRNHVYGFLNLANQISDFSKSVHGKQDQKIYKISKSFENGQKNVFRAWSSHKLEKNNLRYPFSKRCPC